jgi:PAS domain-containing protein
MERNLFKYSVPLASKGLLAAPPLMDLIEGSTLAGALMDAIREPLLVLDGDLHVVTANRSFYLEFKLERQDVQDRSVYALGDGQWNIPELRLLLENVAPQHAVMDACEVEQDSPASGDAQ